MVEVVVVVVILAVLAGLIVPRLGGSVGAARLREAARGLLVAARYARDYAVTHRCCCRLVIDADESRCALQYQTDPEHRPGQYAAVGGSLARGPVLEGPVRLGRVRIGRTGEGSDRGCVVFRPTGQADPAVIEITDGRWTWSVVILPSSGRARLVEGPVAELPNDREDLDA